MQTPSASRRSVIIGERVISSDQPTYIVAEAGVNHDGSPRKALELVDAAADARADAVKFQVFCAESLASRRAPTAAYQRASSGNSQQQMLRRLELSDADLERIRDYCHVRAIEFLATPFSPPDVARLVRLGVRAIKIASTDLNNGPLLREAALTGLPLIVSTGAATTAEIVASVRSLRELKAADRLVLLHCVSRYPTPLNAANLRSIGELWRRFLVPVGYSDHTTSTVIGGWAAAAGACLLEKHLTLDQAAIGPDHAISLNPHEFAAYVAIVREIEVALGKPKIGMSDLEGEVRRVARKSVVAMRALRAGERITPDSLGLKRPGTGLAPDALEQLVGRRLAVDVEPDTLLSWDMLQ